MAGQVYLVTVVCEGRRSRFTRFDVACAVARELSRADSWQDARLFAWVLMPDHLHAMIQLGDVPLGRVMQQVNSRTARVANAQGQEQGRVWQPAYHDHALRAEEDMRRAARYLVANPLRAGLVEHIGDYPFWDAIWLDGESHPLSP